MLKLNKVSGRSSYLACSWTPTISTSLSEEVMLISSLIWVLPGEGLSLARKPGSKRPTRGTNAHTHNMLNGLHDSEMSWRRTFSNLTPPPPKLEYHHQKSSHSSTDGAVIQIWMRLTVASGTLPCFRCNQAFRLLFYISAKSYTAPEPLWITAGWQSVNQIQWYYGKLRLQDGWKHHTCQENRNTVSQTKGWQSMGKQGNKTTDFWPRCFTSVPLLLLLWQILESNPFFFTKAPQCSGVDFRDSSSHYSVHWSVFIEDLFD